jgi:hypothetical protein
MRYNLTNALADVNDGIRMMERKIKMQKELAQNNTRFVLKIKHQFRMNRRIVLPLRCPSAKANYKLCGRKRIFK